MSVLYRGHGRCSHVKARLYTMGYCVYFVDKNFSGSSVDESVVWLSVFAFFSNN